MGRVSLREMSGGLQGIGRLLDRHFVGVYGCDSSGRLTYYNKQASVLWGCSPDLQNPSTRLCGAHKAYRMGGEPLPPSEGAVAMALGSGEPVYGNRLILERPDGSRLIVTENVELLVDDRGNAGAVCCLSEEGAAASANFMDLHEVLQALPVAVYTTDAEGYITYYNEAAAALAGRTPELGERWCVTWRLRHADGTPMAHEDCPMAIALKEGRPVRDAEAIAERPDGTTVSFVPYPTPLRDPAGNVTGAVNMLVDVTDLHRAEADSARLAAIVTSSDDAIISKTLDGLILTWNEGATRIFGYNATEMIGTSITRLIPPELLHEEDEILRRVRAGERIDHFETVRVAKDGRRIDISVTVSPVRSRSGRIIGASKVARDIHERKKAEAAQRLLIGELNHRVKNTLAVVQSMANQTLRRAKDPAEFVAHFSGRIQAFAAAHALLTESRWQSVSMAELAHSQLRLGGNEDGRISLSGPNVALDPQMALQIALVLHELGTNARKHGALSVPDGRLSLVWSVSRDPGCELTLRWKEDPGSKIVTPGAAGFGTSLIQQLVKETGSAHMDCASNGISWNITISLPEVVETPLAAGVRSRECSISGPADREQPARLAAKRVLVVEDEPLIALEIAQILKDVGVVVIGPAASIEGAFLAIAEHQAEGIDAGLLDMNLSGRPVCPVADALTSAQIPYAFLTGYGRDELSDIRPGTPIIRKPFGPGQILEILGDLLEQPAGNAVRLRLAE
jgi:PAS domain S-box-containing protein